MITTSSEFSQPIEGYEIEALLGRGGTSAVYRARQKSLDRTVALKVIRRDKSQNRVTIARLTKEARILARLNHPNVIRSIELGEQGDLIYFAMEFIDGRSAKEWLEERGPLAPKEVVVIAEKVARALEHASVHGIVHRDVKPGNLLLGKDGSVRLSDFGLARLEQDHALTREGLTVGTPQYMSPEQVRNARSVDHKSDLYSLGATLYHLATGHAPFEGDTVSEILHKVMYGQPLPPEHWIKDFPRTLSKILARLMAKKPALRYASGAMLRADLARVQDAWRAGDGQDLEDIGLSWEESGRAPRFHPSVRWLSVVSILAATLLWWILAVSLDRGSSSSADSRATEVRALESLRQRWTRNEIPVLDLVGDVMKLRDERILTPLSAAERLELEHAARVRVESLAAEATAAARKKVHTELGAARWMDLEPVIATILDRELKVAFSDPAAADRMRILGFAEIRERALADLHDRLREVIGDLSRSLKTTLTEFNVKELRECEDLLSAHRFEQVEQRRATVAKRRSDAAFATVVDGLARHGIAVDGGIADEVLAQGVDFATLDALSQGQDSLLMEIGEARDQARITLEQRLVQSIQDELSQSLVVARRDPWSVNVEEWTAALVQRSLPAGLAAEDVDQLGVRWRGVLEVYRSSLREHVEMAQQAERGVLLARLLDGERGIDGMLRDCRMSEARALLESLDGPALRNEIEQLRCVVDTMSSCEQSFLGYLDAHLGREVTLSLKSGIQLRGVLERDAAGGFGIAAKLKQPISFGEIDWASLTEICPAPEQISWMAALHYYWGRSRDREIADRLLDQSPDSFLVEHLRELRRRERAVEQEQRSTWLAESRALKDEFLAARTAGDATRADEAWRQLRMYRESPAFRELNQEREEIEKWLAQENLLGKLEQRLAEQFPHARRTVEAGPMVHLIYGFDRPEELEDFSGLSSARVQNGLLRKEAPPPERESQALLAGPMLRLKADPRSASSWVIVFSVPVEDPRPPRYFFVQCDSFAVGFFRPGEPLREKSYPWQLNVWGGTIDQWQGYFYLPFDSLDPAASLRRRPMEGLGLERARTTRLEIKQVPPSTVEVWIDGELAHRVALKQELESTGLFGWRTISALSIDSIEFHGRLQLR